MSNELEWELVKEAPFHSKDTPLPKHHLFRARVAGGWLVLLSETGSSRTMTYAAGLTFVPGTKWIGGDEDRKKLGGSAVKAASPRGA